MSNGTAIHRATGRCFRGSETASGFDTVTVRAMLTGAAAEAGAVRFDLDGQAVILVAVDQDPADRADLLAELVRPWERIVLDGYDD